MDSKLDACRWGLPSACLTVAMRSDTRSVIHGTCACLGFDRVMGAAAFFFCIPFHFASDGCYRLFDRCRFYRAAQVPVCLPSKAFLYGYTWKSFCLGFQVIFFELFFLSLVSPFVVDNQNAIELGRVLTLWNMAYVCAIAYYCMSRVLE